MYASEIRRQFMNFDSNISSTESDVNICIVKAWIASDKLYDLSDKITDEFF